MEIDYKKIGKDYETFIEWFNKIVPWVVGYHQKLWNIVEENWKLFYNNWFDPITLIKSISDFFKQEIKIDINIINILWVILKDNINFKNESDKHTFANKGASREAMEDQPKQDNRQVPKTDEEWVNTDKKKKK